MRICFIDLETNGIPKHPTFNVYYSYTQTKQYDSSRIVQIALIIYDVDETTNEFKLVAQHNYIIKPDKFSIGNSHIHRITNTIANVAGIPFISAIDKVKNDLISCNTLIAHNILFDRNVLLSELHRYKIDAVIYAINKMNYFCTSLGCTNITKIRYNARQYKQPRLSELYKFLFKKDIKNAHDALIDTKALAECFIEMCKKNLIHCTDGVFYTVN
jgi:DNA polymerase III epsilon subunit-like protein